ncbi:MAG: thiamine biosynthesis protein ApbE [Candidatus Omnitrophica bacterium CG11_big_fil_rev_8_21_14_0_20_42_13]|uniref:FAD:protein FMN transferase n=1 Tax=Candidatus Ghiorseimicrobium undicola TaxID=1974746 RepID=A0A2H0LWP1_9BACT|nr:MAG: thiamine biosynthesis protein ApbE [Candidatus Omnitrophica bacterium CG11_big_fil_rev_8_21_14_0_20_42_13]
MSNTNYFSNKHGLSRFLLLVTGCCLLVTGLSACSSKPYFTQTRLIMGTVVEITATDKSAIEKAFSEIERIDALMSIYNPNSEISRLNKQHELKVSPDTLYVLEKAKYFYEKTEGAFDITVGPLVKLWNIKENMYKDADRIRVPAKDKIDKMLSYIGSNFIDIDAEKSIIKLQGNNLVLDLGGIAKGYAVDKAVEELKRCGVTSALVNAGGDLYCLGKKGWSYWTIGLQDPYKRNEISRKFALKNRAVATSGNYEQFFIYQNKRYSHIIDPRTGYPVDNNICSVSVFAGDCLTADVLATAIYVLGEEQGGELAKQFNDVEIKIMAR